MQDLMFVTDATGSMGSFLDDLRKALPQIFDLVHLTGMFDRLSVLAFRDYCDDKLIEWSGWSSLSEAESLSTFVGNLQATGGGDTPEAGKTGLLEACKKVEKATICILYVDAPPHHKFKGDSAGDNHAMELAALGEENCDWDGICQQLRNRKVRVYPMFPHLDNSTNPFFVHLAEVTGGQCFEIQQHSILRSTIGVLLSIAGVEFEHDRNNFSLTLKDNTDVRQIVASESELYSEPPERKEIHVAVIEEIAAKVGNLNQRFRTSEEYQSSVFEVFKRLLTPERVMAFTYNTVFGKLWREICLQRKDPRREKLVDQLSRTVTAVSDADRSVLQEFLDETYDQTAEIEEIVSRYGTDGPFYVIDCDVPLKRKFLFEIGRSCAPAACLSVLKLLTGLRVTNKLPDELSRLTYIPVDMEPSLKFKLLPHLMCPGTMFTFRLSAIMAALAKISGSILQDDAEKHLKASKGKWIDLTLPENNSMDFARLVLKVAKEALTDDEEKFYRAFVKVGSLKKAKSRELDVETSYSSYKAKRLDHKDQCKKCKQWRSLTLLLDENCALCIFEAQRREELLSANVGIDGVVGLSAEIPSGKVEANLSFPEPKEEKTSWMCECRACLVHYAVYHVDELKCKAKCHFCRIGEAAPFVECLECRNKFLYQRSHPMKDFVCAVCTEHGSKVGQKDQVTVEAYVATNGAGFIGMKIDDVSKFFDSANKIFKTTAEERIEAVRNFAEVTESDLAGHVYIVNAQSENQKLTKAVWNVEELQRQIFDIFAKPKISQCMICFEDVPVEKLGDICGRVKKGCSVKACKTCLVTWYNQLAPGRVCQPAQLLCPYCKHSPSLKIVRQYNRRLCALLNLIDVAAFDPSFVHAWCMECYAIKQAMRRECAGEDQTIVDFNCDDCAKNKKSQFKECPKCKVLTEKNGGCNHIACENILSTGEKCDAHWCWICGTLSTYNNIYAHLSSAHGGFFLNEDGDEYDEMEE